MTAADLPIPTDRLADFCRRWKITELSLFGSVLRDDFGPESDVDVLDAFDDDANWDSFDWPAMQEELSSMLGGRLVDLAERKSLRNPFGRHVILTSRRVLHASTVSTVEQ